MRCLLALVVHPPPLAGPLLAFEDRLFRRRQPTFPTVRIRGTSSTSGRRPATGLARCSSTFTAAAGPVATKDRSAKIKPFLDRGISYASINYRLTDQAILPTPVHDAARRHPVPADEGRRLEYRFEEDRPDRRKRRRRPVRRCGSSCTTIWRIRNPMTRFSGSRHASRPPWGIAGQTSIDPKVVEGWVGLKILEHRMINLSVGEPTIADALRAYEKAQGPLRRVLADQSSRPRRPAAVSGACTTTK